MYTLLAAGIQIVIPPKRNQKEQREYDEYLYKLRHLVENAFLHLKQWRSIATRYAKNTASFVALFKSVVSDFGLKCMHNSWQRYLRPVLPYTSCFEKTHDSKYEVFVSDRTWTIPLIIWLIP